MTIIEKISQIGFIPAFALKDTSKAIGLARALENGGIPIIEIACHTAQDTDCIREIRRNYPDFIVGAGSILSIEQAKNAIDCGALYITSPGYDEIVVKHCLNKDIPIFPGVSNPSDIQLAVNVGLKVLRLFPVETIGGISTINLLAEAFPEVLFIPAGGVQMSNLSDYSANMHVIACAGSFVACQDMIGSENWEGITQLCQQVIRTILGFEFAHLGVNCNTAERALASASFFNKAFDQPSKEGANSIFVKGRIELMKKPFYGTYGHIGYFTNSIECAIYHLKQRGFDMQEDTIRVNNQGRMLSAYLDGETAGFAVHIVRR